MPTISERHALRTAGALRARRRRLLADIDPDAKAKVIRLPRRLGPMPTAVATQPEAAPYEKFGGVR